MKFSKDEIREGAGLAALSYIFFVCIIVLIFSKNNKFVRFHARQALVVFIFEVFFWFLGWFIPIIGPLFSFIGSLIFFVYSLLGIFASLLGKAIRFPLITSLASKMVI